MNLRGRARRVRILKKCIIDAIHATNDIENIGGENYNASDDALLKIAKWFYDAEVSQSREGDEK